MREIVGVFVHKETMELLAGSAEYTAEQDVETRGRVVEFAPVSLLAVDGVGVGDYVFHHAGLALARVEPDEAREILEALGELDALWEAEAVGVAAP